MPEKSRRELALQSAEKIFAQYGYDGATMRMIADDAELKLALLTYHFRTKLNLYREVFAQHQSLNEMRVKALREVDVEADEAIERIVDAFLIIGHVNTDDIRKARYLRVVLREAADPQAYDRGILTEFFDPMAREFIRALHKAMPHQSSGFARWGYLFAVGALITSNFDDRERVLAEGAINTEDRLALLRNFIVAGLKNGGA